MDVAGRRPLLIVPMVVMIVDLIGMTICLILQVRPTPIQVVLIHDSLGRQRNKFTVHSLRKLSSP